MEIVKWIISAAWLTFAIIIFADDIRNKRPYTPWGYVAVICSQIWAAF